MTRVGRQNLAAQKAAGVIKRYAVDGAAAKDFNALRDGQIGHSSPKT
ncbi:MAG: hypothetical protein LC676_05350 [Loktanella sp.]|nr:hypothetical protein [Loktanella sp.]